jgi:hypothetical protein
MTERQFLAAVVELADELGLLVYHVHDSRQLSVSDPGFPDLVLAGGRGVIFAELKTESGELSPAQLAWKYRLQAAGAAWRLWRPSMLHAGILRDMKGIA